MGGGVSSPHAHDDHFDEHGNHQQQQQHHNPNHPYDHNAHPILKTGSSKMMLALIKEDVPREVTAEDAVKRLKAMPNNYNHRMLVSLAKPKFQELDKDKNGFLIGESLVEVAAAVLPRYKPGGCKASDEDDAHTLKDLRENINTNPEPMTIEDLCAVLEYTSARVSLRSASFGKFRELDSDGSGYLDRDELKLVVEWVLEQFSSLGLSNSDEENIRRNFINKVDSNTDGKLDEEEFAEMFEEVAMSAHLMRNARAKFTELDADSSDSLEGPELAILCDWVIHIYYPRGVPINDYEKELIKSKIMKNIDANGDGCLDIQEFSGLFEEITLRIELNKRARKKFLELDVDNSGKLDVQEIELVADWVLKLCAPNIDKAAIKANFLKKMSLQPDLKLDLYEFTTLYMQFLRILDIKRRGSLKYLNRDVTKKNILDIDEIPPVVQQMLDAFSLLPQDKEIVMENIQSDIAKDMHENGNGTAGVTIEKVFEKVEDNILKHPTSTDTFR